MSLRQGPTKKFWGGRGWAWHSECLGHLGRVKSVWCIRTSESGGHRGRDSKMHNFVGKTYICLLILSFLHFLEGRGEKVPVPPPLPLCTPLSAVFVDWFCQTTLKRSFSKHFLSCYYSHQQRSNLSLIAWPITIHVERVFHILWWRSPFNAIKNNLKVLM